VGQWFVFPIENGRIAAELGGVGSSGAGLSEVVEAAGGGNAEIGVAEDLGDLGGEEGEVGQPGGRVVHVEIWLDPREGRTSKEGCCIEDLELVGLELGRLCSEDKAQLGEESGQLGGGFAVERVRRNHFELFGACGDVRSGSLGELGLECAHLSLQDVRSGPLGKLGLECAQLFLHVADEGYQTCSIAVGGHGLVSCLGFHDRNLDVLVAGIGASERLVVTVALGRLGVRTVRLAAGGYGHNGNSGDDGCKQQTVKNQTATVRNRGSAVRNRLWKAWDCGARRDWTRRLASCGLWQEDSWDDGTRGELGLYWKSDVRC